MIPLKDNIPHYRKPYVTVALLIINCAVFAIQLMMGRHMEQFIYMFGFVPVRLFSEVSVVVKTLPVLSSMFMHGSLLHLAGNMLFLWVFADNVEDRLGHFRFLIFYLACGVAATVVHTLFNLRSPLPTIGASGAIAGVLGAYFLLFPRARVLTLIPIFIFWQIVEIPAFFFLGFWFVFQFVLGLFSLGFDCCGGIAFWAHIGGFAAGIGLLFLMLPGASGTSREQRVESRE